MADSDLAATKPRAPQFNLHSYVALDFAQVLTLTRFIFRQMDGKVR